MQNFVKPGDIMTFTAPTGGVVSGTPYLIGGLLVVACSTVAQTLPFEGQVEGVFTLPKAASQAWTEGQKIYWDNETTGNGGQVCTTDATKGQLVGVAAEALGSGSTIVTGKVRLNAAAPATLEGPQTTIAALTGGTNITAATANGVLADSSGSAPTEAQFNELAKELMVKINEIIAAMKAAGIVASS